MMVIPAGSLLTISSGEYSDYIVQGVFRAVRDIDAEALRAEWLAVQPEHPFPNTDITFDLYGFLGWITRKGLLEPVDSFNWDMADRCPWMAVTACEGGTTLPVEAERRSPPPAQSPSDV
jgi:hypothetical protein